MRKVSINVTVDDNDFTYINGVELTLWATTLPKDTTVGDISIDCNPFYTFAIQDAIVQAERVLIVLGNNHSRAVLFMIFEAVNNLDENTEYADDRITLNQIKLAKNYLGSVSPKALDIVFDITKENDIVLYTNGELTDSIKLPKILSKYESVHVSLKGSKRIITKDGISKKLWKSILNHFIKWDAINMNHKTFTHALDHSLIHEIIYNMTVLGGLENNVFINNYFESAEQWNNKFGISEY